MRGVYILRYIYMLRNNREYFGLFGEMDVYNVLWYKYVLFICIKGGVLYMGNVKIK